MPLCLFVSSSISSLSFSSQLFLFLGWIHYILVHWNQVTASKLDEKCDNLCTRVLCWLLLFAWHDPSVVTLASISKSAFVNLTKEEKKGTRRRNISLSLSDAVSVCHGRPTHTTPPLTPVPCWATSHHEGLAVIGFSPRDHTPLSLAGSNECFKSQQGGAIQTQTLKVGLEMNWLRCPVSWKCFPRFFRVVNLTHVSTFKSLPETIFFSDCSRFHHLLVICFFTSLIFLVLSFFRQYFLPSQWRRHYWCPHNGVGEVNGDSTGRGHISAPPDDPDNKKQRQPWWIQLQCQN